MSRIGKQIFDIKAGTTVTVNGDVVSVKGKSGEMKRSFDTNLVEVKVEEGKVSVTPKRNDKKAKSTWGTIAAHIKNMLKGVETPFEKTLIVEGVGFKWEITGKQVKLALGFSHPVFMDIPAGLTVTIEKLTMKIVGIDKDAVGGFAKDIRALKEPEPYKGKGIRYSDEIIKRKQGKRSA